MFETHPSVSTPPDDTVVWRYMTFAQFMKILKSKTIWFSNLRYFDDPWEGAYPARLLKAFNEDIAQQPTTPPKVLIDKLKRLVRSATPENAWEIIEKMMQLNWNARTKRELFDAIAQGQKSDIEAVNCWHANPHESLAMWVYYAKGPGSVAIRSTIGRLKKAFHATKHSIFIGTVRYIDHLSPDCVFHTNGLEWIMQKPNSYAFESEVRLVTIPFVASLHGAVEMASEAGTEIMVDRKSLIESVWTHPKCQEWESEFITKLLAEENLDQVQVRKSFLASKPHDYFKAYETEN